ncbi:MAG: sigma-70 family RNA polymerase sigma factor [Symploca sp. SIO1B1]|nr:sigma-70 family RNA polymerase sigma factor [Symploca sp. SIO1B1]
MLNFRVSRFLLKGHKYIATDIEGTMTGYQDNLLVQLNTTVSPEKNCQDARVQERCELLGRIVNEVLLSSGESDIYHILPFIKRLLKQFKLYSYYEERDIFLEAYARAVKRIEAGGVIDKIPAWFKTTSYNIIRELNKDKNRQQSLITRLANSGQVSGANVYHIPEHIIDANVRLLTKALKELKSEDRIVLKLRIIHNLSWKEIGDYLVERGQEVNNSPKLEQRLRQRGNRAMKRLRRIYHSYKTEES